MSSMIFGEPSVGFTLPEEIAGSTPNLASLVPFRELIPQHVLLALRLLHRNSLFQLLNPVEDILDLRSARGSGLTFSGRDDANKSFAVRSDVVLPLRKRNRSKRQASSCRLWFRIA